MARGNEILFLTVSCVVCGLLSMFMANTALIGAFIPVIDSVCAVSDMKRRNLLLPIACAAMFGGTGTLIGCTPQLTASSLMHTMTGLELGIVGYDRAGTVPVCIVHRLFGYHWLSP